MLPHVFKQPKCCEVTKILSLELLITVILAALSAPVMVKNRKMADVPKKIFDFIPLAPLFS
jgi:hypothetical protein